MVKVTANLTNQGIIIHDDHSKKSSRSMCLPSSSGGGRITVPFENVLNFERDQSQPDSQIYRLVYCKVNKAETTYHAITQTVEFKQHLEEQDITEKVMNQAYPSGCKPFKRFLVLINPFGGKGHAKSIYKKHCEPLLRKAGCKFTVVSTTHRYHAQEIARDLDIDEYDAIVCCSGDGIPHEVINGFQERKDEEDAIRALTSIPICQLPCGSGNSIAWSLNGNASPTRAAWCMIKGKKMPMDLMSFSQGSSVKKLSFLSQCYGVVADADLGTEHLRWMGGTRFIVGTIQRALAQKSYPCEVYIKYGHETKEQVKEYFDKSNNADEPQTVRPSPSSSTPTLQRKYGTPNDPVPDDWVKLDKPKMGLCYVGKMPWVSADAMMFPGSLPHDGMMDMVHWDSNIGRITALDMLTKVEKGEHFLSNIVNYSKIEAYRVVPKLKSGYLSIDGESFPYEPYQVEVLPSLGCLLSAFDNYTKTTMHRF